MIERNVRLPYQTEAGAAAPPRDESVIVSMLAKLENLIAENAKAVAGHEQAIKYVLLPDSPNKEPGPAVPHQQMCDLAQQLDDYCDRLESNTRYLEGLTRRCEL